MSYLRALVSSGPDGLESGVSTSEFAASLVAVAVMLLGPRFGWFRLGAVEQAQLVTVIVGVYTLARGIRKGFAKPVVTPPATPPSTPAG